ncbi:uncharacterized protein ACA1_289240 [Acanthamoeba castellanii str. Neff]|uniref:Uncharacterized protein n=1 Tax=Acanthamoeba castellanii (strain ATCC 30010 / Neff) TaxID=1257118 RepID=L8HJ02_ACACF|nr:uncharacterized protein ACA1_289240 [Acanthamoeba castellanii str. Neff]ELR25192.1 hypothetical protein ACA1_289240 [Acanthamoeba castellanii str. Neff]
MFQRVTVANVISFSLWVRPSAAVADKATYILFQPNLVQIISVVFANITLQPSESYHLAFIYDGEKLCIHVNNTLASPGVTLSDSEAGLDVGSNYNAAQSSWKGTIDELKIYDHALSPIELALLSSSAATANDVPTSQFEVDGTILSATSYTVPAYQNVTLTAVVNDSGKAFSGAPQGIGYADGFGYTWQALSTTCGGITITSPRSRSTQMSFNDVSSATVNTPNLNDMSHTP